MALSVDWDYRCNVLLTGASFLVVVFFSTFFALFALGFASVFLVTDSFFAGAFFSTLGFSSFLVAGAFLVVVAVVDFLVVADLALVSFLAVAFFGFSSSGFSVLVLLFSFFGASDFFSAGLTSFLANLTGPAGPTNCLVTVAEQSTFAYLWAAQIHPFPRRSSVPC